MTSDAPPPPVSAPPRRSHSARIAHVIAWGLLAGFVGGGIAVSIVLFAMRAAGML